MTGVKNGYPVLEDGTVLKVSNVIWCTGFRPDYDWIDLSLPTHNGLPIHDRGIVESCPGLYFIGLLFLYSLSSALVGGVGRDAEHIVDHIVSTRLARRRPRREGDDMAVAKVNGVRLFYEVSGAGEVPLVFVHGSWGSHHNWDLVVPELAESFRVLTYDRRGHSESARPPEQGSVREDVADLAALIEHLELGPAWVAGNSFGASITLRLAGERSDLFRGIIAHEPPLFSLLANDPSVAPMLDEVGKRIGAVVERIASGDDAGAARQFVETVALGPGTLGSALARSQGDVHHECTDVPGRSPRSGAACLRPRMDRGVSSSLAPDNGGPEPPDIRPGG